MAASPLQVCYARERSLIQAEQFIVEYAHPSPAPQQPQSEKMLREVLSAEVEEGLSLDGKSAFEALCAIRDILAVLTPKGEAE